MLKAVPCSWFSWNFTVFNDGEAVARIDSAWMREAGKLIVNGSDYRVYREGLLTGAFVLEKDGEVISRAVKPDILFRTYKVEACGSIYTIEAESPFGRKFLLKRDDQTLGSVQPENAFSRRAEINLPGDLDLAVRIFMAWLILILWKRDSE